MELKERKMGPKLVSAPPFFHFEDELAEEEHCQFECININNNHMSSISTSSSHNSINTNDHREQDDQSYFCLTQPIEPRPFKKIFDVFTLLDWALFVVLLAVGLVLSTQQPDWTWPNVFGSLFFSVCDL